MCSCISGGELLADNKTCTSKLTILITAFKLALHWHLYEIAAKMSPVQVLNKICSFTVAVHSRTVNFIQIFGPPLLVNGYLREIGGKGGSWRGKVWRLNERNNTGWIYDGYMKTL